MQERVEKEPQKLHSRKAIVEHLFGTMKRGWDAGYFLLRGLEKVRGEFSLTALCYNLRRVLNIVGMEKLLAAVGRVLRLWRRLCTALWDREHRQHRFWWGGDRLPSPLCFPARRRERVAGGSQGQQLLSSHTVSRLVGPLVGPLRLWPTG